MQEIAMLHLEVHTQGLPQDGEIFVHQPDWRRILDIDTPAIDQIPPKKEIEIDIPPMDKIAEIVTPELLEERRRRREINRRQPFIDIPVSDRMSFL